MSSPETRIQFPFPTSRATSKLRSSHCVTTIASLKTSARSCLQTCQPPTSHTTTHTPLTRENALLPIQPPRPPILRILRPLHYLYSVPGLEGQIPLRLRVKVVQRRHVLHRRRRGLRLRLERRRGRGRLLRRDARGGRGGRGGRVGRWRGGGAGLGAGRGRGRFLEGGAGGDAVAGWGAFGEAGAARGGGNRAADAALAAALLDEAGWEWNELYRSAAGKDLGRTD